MVKFYQLLSGHLIKKFRTCVLLSLFERVTADKKPLSALSRCTVQIDQITKGLLQSKSVLFCSYHPSLWNQSLGIQMVMAWRPCWCTDRANEKPFVDGAPTRRR